MIINIIKCTVVSFSRLHEVINFKYTINDLILSRLTFKPHLNNVISRANRKWYFIFRHTKEFKNANFLRILYLGLY